MKIRELRNKKNLSQKELGEKIGESENTISNWERGVSNPSAEKLIQMSKIFGVTVDYILGNVVTIELPEVKNFANDTECQTCKAKDILIEELRSKIKDKEMIINLLLKNSDPINKSAI